MLQIKNSNFQNTADFIKEFDLLLEFYRFFDFNDFNLNKKNRQIDISAVNFPWEKSVLQTIKPILLSNIYDSQESKQFYFYTDLRKLNKADVLHYSIHITNEPDPFAEAILLFLIDSIVYKLLNKKILVEINSLGSKDTVDKYLIDLRKFLKRRKKNLPQSVVNEYDKGNYIKALNKLIGMKHPESDNAPFISDYLSEFERKHFYSLLDYLENLGVNYTFNNKLFATPNIWQLTVMNLYLEEDSDFGNKQIGYGGRIDNLIQKYHNSNANHVFINLEIENYGRKKNIEKNKKEYSSVKFFFAQIGLLAKSKGAKLLESMQDAGLDVEHTICNLSLIEQYKLAINKGAKYLIILGHKEAVEDSVIVRNLEDNTQQLVSEHDLIKYLKKLN